MTGRPSEAEVRAARDILRRHAGAGGREVALSRTYPDFAPDDAYRAGLPDMQRTGAVRGADRRIQHVGISGFRLPMRIPTRSGEQTAPVHVTGTVGLEAGRKGIDMSRIMRGFYAQADTPVDFALADAVIDGFLRDLDATEARLLLRFPLALRQRSLRSELEGWQYYDAAIEAVQVGGRRIRVVHLDYVYSSTCPCSLELAEHARTARGQLAAPHSQRSVARLSVEAVRAVTPEDLVDLCRRAVPTETQVLVRRVDEQAFAELNAAHPVFVEDASRLFAEGLGGLPGAGDFRIVVSHQESLHSHDAVSVLTHGDLFTAQTLDPRLFGTLTATG